MSFSRWFITCLLLCGALSVALADEQVLATIHIGMKPKELTKLLGEPTAIIIAQPPVSSPDGSNPRAPRTPGMPGIPGMIAPADKPNTLVLITGEGNNRTEIELPANAGASTTRSTSSTGATGQKGRSGYMGMGQMGMGQMGMGKNDNKTNTTLPVWAYTVRVSRLALDQQQLIYRINKSYSLGITITGQGAEARVSDIVACSFQPFTMKAGPVKVTKEREDSSPSGRDKNTSMTATIETTGLTFVAQAPDFYFLHKMSDGSTHKEWLPAGTTKKVGIGSTLRAVLQAHGWPSGFLPFKADEYSIIPMDKLPKKPSVSTDASSSLTGTFSGMSAHTTSPMGSGLGRSPGGNQGGNTSAKTKTPVSNEIALNPDGTVSPDTLSTVLAMAKEKEQPIAEFQNSTGTHLTVPFTDSCLLIYADAHIEFTLVHSVVVRIHIGKGVVKPDVPIPPAS